MEFHGRTDNSLKDKLRGTHPFSGRGVQPGFPKCGACELIIASEIGSCELEIVIFWGLRAKIWAKIEVTEANISIFFLKRGFVN